MIGGVSPLSALMPAGIGSPAGAAPSSAKAAEAGASFASALTQAAENAVATLEQAESLSIQGLQGGVQTREVVDAVMSAEQALQAAIAIRDKIVTAWLDVSRMQI